MGASGDHPISVAVWTIFMEVKGMAPSRVETRSFMPAGPVGPPRLGGVFDHVGVMVGSTSTSGQVRLAEIVGALSLTTDLATGWPIEHGLGRSLLAVWLGEELGLDAAELSDAYCVGLLGSVGCTIEGTLFAEYTSDDIAASARTSTVDFTSPLEVTAFAVRTFGAGQPPLKRVRSLVSAAISGNADFQAVCRDVAVRVGDMLDIGASIQQALAQCPRALERPGRARAPQGGCHPARGAHLPRGARRRDLQPVGRHRGGRCGRSASSRQAL